MGYGVQGIAWVKCNGGATWGVGVQGGYKGVCIGYGHAQGMG